MQKQVNPIVIILVIIVLVGAGWLYWKYLNREETAKSSPTPNATSGGLPQPGSMNRVPNSPPPGGWGQRPGVAPSTPSTKPVPRPAGVPAGR